MTDPSVKDRRVFRLATLLTGDREHGRKILETVVRERGELDPLDPVHLDRLIVLRSREIEPDILVDPLVPHVVAVALARMDPQQREAWLLAHVDGMDDRRMAQAMDCSRTATARHLERAETIWSSTGIAPAEAAGHLRTFAEHLGLPESYIERRKRWSRRRLGVRIAFTTVTFIILVAGVFLIWRMATQWL